MGSAVADCWHHFEEGANSSGCGSCGGCGWETSQENESGACLFWGDGEGVNAGVLQGFGLGGGRSPEVEEEREVEEELEEK